MFRKKIRAQDQSEVRRIMILSTFEPDFWPEWEHWHVTVFEYNSFVWILLSLYTYLFTAMWKSTDVGIGMISILYVFAY